MSMSSPRLFLCVVVCYVFVFRSNGFCLAHSKRRFLCHLFFQKYTSDLVPHYHTHTQCKEDTDERGRNKTHRDGKENMTPCHRDDKWLHGHDVATGSARAFKLR